MLIRAKRGEKNLLIRAKRGENFCFALSHGPPRAPLGPPLKDLSREAQNFYFVYPREARRKLFTYSREARRKFFEVPLSREAQRIFFCLSARSAEKIFYLFARSAENFFLTWPYYFLCRRPRTKLSPQVGRRLEQGWPYYFLCRRPRTKLSQQVGRRLEQGWPYSAAPPGTSVLDSTGQGLSSIAASKVFA